MTTLIGLILFSVISWANPPCGEERLQRHTPLAAWILQHAVEDTDGTLTRADLEKFAAASLWFNPFSLSRHKLLTGPYRRAFDQAAANLSESERLDVKAAVRAHLAKTAGDSNRSEAAAKELAQILSPQLAPESSYPELLKAAEVSRLGFGDSGNFTAKVTEREVLMEDLSGRQNIMPFDIHTLGPTAFGLDVVRPLFFHHGNRLLLAFPYFSRKLGLSDRKQGMSSIAVIDPRTHELVNTFREGVRYPLKVADFNVEPLLVFSEIPNVLIVANVVTGQVTHVPKPGTAGNFFLFQQHGRTLIGWGGNPLHIYDCESGSTDEYKLPGIEGDLFGLKSFEYLGAPYVVMRGSGVTYVVRLTIPSREGNPAPH